MKLVVANEWLEDRGGTETYTVLVADHLARLGHEVTVYTHRAGVVAQEARQLGLKVAVGATELPQACEGAITQDQVLAFELAERYPAAPQVFTVHSELGLQLPPHLRDVVGAVVVLHDRVGRRVEAMAQEAEIVRLRQPVDLQRFFPRRPLSERLSRAVLVGNYTRGQRRDVLTGVLDEAGIQWTAVGRHGEGERGDLETVMGEADVVFGKARVIVEAMACGRAAYVYDWNGCDGWVTPERYPALEADNFGGQAEPTAVTPERLAADLQAYRPDMGLANRDLAVANHSAMHHTEALVELFGRLGARRSTPSGPLEEMAWMARQNMRLEFGYAGRWAELQSLYERIADLERTLVETEAERDQARDARDDAVAHWRRVEEFQSTRRYRVAQALSAPLDLTRRALARRARNGDDPRRDLDL